MNMTSNSVHDLSKMVGTEAEEQRLDKIIHTEKTHRDWKRHAICVAVLIMMIMVNLLRGSKSRPSFVGIERCGPVDIVI